MITSMRKGLWTVKVMEQNGQLVRTEKPRNHASINAAKRANGLNQATYDKLPPMMKTEGEDA